MNPLILILPVRPLSANAQYQQGFRARIGDQARAFEREPLTGTLYARILWFHRYSQRQDVDNIIKPILDALKGIVYADDFTVTHCMAARIALQGPVLFGDVEPVAELLAMLDDANKRDVLYIEIGRKSRPEVVTGEVL